MDSLFSGTLLPKTFIDDFRETIPNASSIDDDVVTAFIESVSESFSNFPTDKKPNESQTEDDLIWRVLESLGWEHTLRQQILSEKGQELKPDGILFRSKDDKKKANELSKDYMRYRLSPCLVESKRWRRPLDRRGDNEDDAVTPSFQILNYLTRANIVTEERLKWGLLTNGETWRLYWQDARSRKQDFLGINLWEAIKKNDKPAIQLFMFFFGPSGFQFSPDTGILLIEEAVSQGKRFEAQLADDLSQTVFDIAFPEIANGILESSPTASLGEVRDAALTALYRLLFILYAEDRALLPINQEKYAVHSLRRTVRDEVANAIKDNIDFSEVFSTYWDRFQSLSKAIDKGDKVSGLPAYNGGLFSSAENPILTNSKVSDSRFSKVLRALCFFPDSKDSLRYINFRDLSVQHLGSIYERLLEYDLIKDDQNNTIVAKKVFERKGSGSYYTRDELVELIIVRTVGPLITEASKAKDPAKEILNLRICDPAMGSGHFLVSLVDYLAEEISIAIAESDGQSTVMDSVEKTRSLIEQNAEDKGWAVNEEQLDDPQLLRRMILKRCIYGVDKNSMAVELAKVALWLHTFTVGAPLSFLDHHLVTGDSVFGLWVNDWLKELDKEGQLLMAPLIGDADEAEARMKAIELRSDAELDEVEASKKDYVSLKKKVSNLESFMSFAHAVQWLDLDKNDQGILGAFYNDAFGNPEWIVTGRRKPNTNVNNGPRFYEIWAQAQELMKDENFFHWEPGFPGVWQNWASPSKRSGGFDAIIGNPPWNQFEFDKQEWWQRYRKDFQSLRNQTEVKAKIKELRGASESMVEVYDLASKRASQRIKRGKANLKFFKDRKYQLHYDFVERALQLIKPDGRIGLLVPSGVLTNKGAEGFAKNFLRTGRVEAFIDFVNYDYPTGRFFPEVHPQTKFCALVIRSDQKEHIDVSVRTNISKPLPQQTSELSLDVLDALSPETQLLPSFPDSEGYQIGIEATKHSTPFISSEFSSVMIPAQLFNASTDMDDAVFYDRAIDAGIVPTEAGFVGKTGKFLPELQGKNVGIYNDRANSIHVVPSNNKRKAQERPSSYSELRDPTFSVTPYRIAPASKWPKKKLPDWVIAFKDVTASDNSRTMIAAVIPKCIPTHTLPVLMPREGKLDEYQKLAPLLLGNLNSYAYDYFVRTRVQTSHMSFYVFEEAPVIPINRYAELAWGFDLKDEVKFRVGRLSASSNKLISFAETCGLSSIQIFDEDTRRHDMARLDAIYLALYGITDNQKIDKLFSNFERIKKSQLKNPDIGYYKTRELVKSYLRLYEAGDKDSTVNEKELEKLYKSK